MLGSLLTRFASVEFLLSSPVALAIFAFQIWMLVDAIRQREYVWALFVFFGWGFAALWYYLYVYRASPAGLRGFQLPGVQDRRRIKQLQDQIHHLDKAHHHSQLADLYFHKGKLQLAERSYRAALERDPDDLDTRSHLGQCLLRQHRPAEAKPLLAGVIAQNPKHDYAHSLMALAETLTALGETEAALALWRQVTQMHSYPRAKVQLAELYLTRGQTDLARGELSEVVADDLHAPPFQRRRDRVWFRRARKLLRSLPR